MGRRTRSSEQRVPDKNVLKWKQQKEDPFAANEVMQF